MKWLINILTWFFIISLLIFLAHIVYISFAPEIECYEDDCEGIIEHFPDCDLEIYPYDFYYTWCYEPIPPYKVNVE